jgi:hypothetical protein
MASSSSAVYSWPLLNMLPNSWASFLRGRRQAGLAVVNQGIYCKVGTSDAIRVVAAAVRALCTSVKLGLVQQSLALSTRPWRNAHLF